MNIREKSIQYQKLKQGIAQLDVMLEKITKIYEQDMKKAEDFITAWQMNKAKAEKDYHEAKSKLEVQKKEMETQIEGLN